MDQKDTIITAVYILENMFSPKQVFGFASPIQIWSWLVVG